MRLGLGTRLSGRRSHAGTTPPEEADATPNGVASAAVTGLPGVTVVGTIQMLGISSPVSVPVVPQLGQSNLGVTGISSTGTITPPTILRIGPVTPNDLASGSTTSGPALAAVSGLQLNSIATSPTTGTTTAAEGQLADLADIETAPFVGAPAISAVTGTSPSSIASAPTVGTTGVAVSGLAPNSISSAVTLPAPTVGVSGLVPTGISSSPTVGVPALASVSNVPANSISSTATTSGPAVTAATGVNLSGIASVNTVGQPAISGITGLVPTGISSASFRGAPAISGISGLNIPGRSSSAFVGNPAITNIRTLLMNSVASSSFVGAPAVTPLVLDPVQRGSWIRTAGTSGTVPTHSTGELIVVIATRQDASGQPTLPGGYTDIPISLGANAPAIRMAYKVAASGSETVSGFTSAQSTTIGVFQNVASVLDGTEFKTGAAAATTLTWGGVPSLSTPALVIGVAMATSTDDPALRSDLTEDITHNIIGANGRVRIGHSTGGVVSSWGATTSVKTGSVSRAIVAEFALLKA